MAQKEETYQLKPFLGSSHYWAIERILSFDKASAILDIGCATGKVGQQLREAGFNRLSAVEVDAGIAEIARPFYETVAPDLGTFKGCTFDLILLLDVLEHTPDPAGFLREAVSLLNPGGTILISTPNIAHWSTRFMLLFGRFNYAERGIMDKTHLHFFTRSTFKKLIQENGSLKLKNLDLTIEPAEFILPEWISKSRAFLRLSKIRLGLARLFPGLMAYQNLAEVIRQEG